MESLAETAKQRKTTRKQKELQTNSQLHFLQMIKWIQLSVKLEDYKIGSC